MDEVEKYHLFKPGEHCRIRSGVDIEGYSDECWGKEVIVQDYGWDISSFWAKTPDGKEEYLLMHGIEVEALPPTITATEATEIQQQVARILQL